MSGRWTLLVWKGKTGKDGSSFAFKLGRRVVDSVNRGRSLSESVDASGRTAVFLYASR